MGKKTTKSDDDKVVERFKKLLKEMDELRTREMKRFSDEFDRRMDEFHELQSNVLERLGISSKKSDTPKKNKATAKKPSSKKAAAKKPGTKKSAAKKPSAAAPKSASGSAASPAAKAADPGDLTRIKGIGPATAKKMKDAGITDISQVANPTAADEEKLAAFKNVKGFSSLSAEAKKVL